MVAGSVQRKHRLAQHNALGEQVASRRADHPAASGERVGEARAVEAVVAGAAGRRVRGPEELDADAESGEPVGQPVAVAVAEVGRDERLPSDVRQIVPAIGSGDAGARCPRLDGQEVHGDARVGQVVRGCSAQLLEPYGCPRQVGRQSAPCEHQVVADGQRRQLETSRGAQGGRVAVAHDDVWPQRIEASPVARCAPRDGGQAPRTGLNDVDRLDLIEVGEQVECIATGHDDDPVASFAQALDDLARAARVPPASPVDVPGDGERRSAHDAGRYDTPVRSSDTAHRRAAAASSRDAALLPTFFG